jgi:hypothetical protein
VAGLELSAGERGRSRETRGTTRALLNREVGSEAAGHVTPRGGTTCSLACLGLVLVLVCGVPSRVSTNITVYKLFSNMKLYENSIGGMEFYFIS